MARRSRSLDDVGAEKPKKPKKAPTPPKKRGGRLVMPTAKSVLAELRAMEGVQDEDYAFFSDPLAWTSSVKEWIPTGSLALDRLTSGEHGGGWPVGRLVEVAAWEQVGKSTLLDQSIAIAQQEGVICGLIDSEQARDERYTKKLGVNVDELIVHKARTIEDGFIGLDRMLSIQEGLIKKLAKKKARPPIMLLVWDSIGGTPTRAELNGAADDKHVMEAARSIKMNMRRFAQRVAQSRVCLIFANQFYQSGIGGFGPSLVSYGGSGIRYFTSLRIWLSRTGQLKQGDRVIGQTVQAKLKKTRVCMPRPPAELGLLFGFGFHNAYTLFEWGKTHGVSDDHKWIVVRSSWAWLMLPDGTHVAFQGKYLGFADVLSERPAVYKKMADQYVGEEA